MNARRRSGRTLAFALVAAVLGAASSATAQHEDEPPSAARCRALAALQDEGRFDVRAAVAALADEDEAVARTAAAIVRHEWRELPPELFVALAQAPRAATALLRELALAPRPSAADRAKRQALPLLGRSTAHRLFALAARGGPLTAADVPLLLDALAEPELGEAAALAAALVPAELADAQLGRLHQQLLDGALPIERAGPLLDRLSPLGVERLLGLALTLPEELQWPLLARIEAVRPELVLERAAAALDGDAPLEAPWLRHAAPVLTTPARRERVLALLDDPRAAVRDAAFAALARAQVVDERLFAAAFDGEHASPARIRQLLHSMLEQLPAAQLARWLAGPPEFAEATAQALVRLHRLPPEVEHKALDLLRPAERADRALALTLLTTVVHAGSDEALAAVWPLLRTSEALDQLLDRLLRRREPFVRERLSAWLASADRDGLAAEQRNRLRLALLATGDRSELAALLAIAPAASPTFVRRAAQHAGALSTSDALALLDRAFLVEDPDLASELLGWAAQNRDPEVVERLWQRFVTPPTGDEQELLDEVLLRALLHSERRTRLLAAFRDRDDSEIALERLRNLPFEWVTMMPVPLSAADLEACAEFVLAEAGHDPVAERQRMQRWPDGLTGFPLVRAVAQRLRDADPAAAGQAFAAVVANVDPEPLSRQRLSVLWQSLGIVPEVKVEVGIHTAPLWDSARGDDEVGRGASRFFLALGAERRGEFEAAARHYTAARDALLRLPSTRRTARWLLGERDPAAGHDPWAALSAAPHLAAARAAAVLGDADALSTAAKLVVEFAGRDVATIAALQSVLPKESER